MWKQFLVYILTSQNLGISNGLKCWNCFYAYDDSQNPMHPSDGEDNNFSTLPQGNANCVKRSTLDLSTDLVECPHNSREYHTDELAYERDKGGERMFCETVQVRSKSKSLKYVDVQRGCKSYPDERSVGCKDIAETNKDLRDNDDPLTSGSVCLCDTDKCNGADFIPPEPLVTCHENCDLECFICDSDSDKRPEGPNLECSESEIPDNDPFNPYDYQDDRFLSYERCGDVIPQARGLLNDRKPKHVVYACATLAWKQGNRKLIRRRCMGLLIDKANLKEKPGMGCKETKMPGGYWITEYLCNTSGCNKDLKQAPYDCNWFNEISRDESGLEPQKEFVWPPGTFSSASSNTIQGIKLWNIFLILLYKISM